MTIRSANAGRGYESPIMATGRNHDQVRDVLAPWLARQLGVPRVGIGAIQTPAGSGVANETLLVEAVPANSRDDMGRWFTIKIEPREPLFDERPLLTQWQVHEALFDLDGPPVPEPVGYEDDSELLGMPFFVTARVEGMVPADRPHFTESGFLVDATPEQRRRLWTSAVEALAQVHQVPRARVGFLEPSGPASGLETEMSYWRGFTDRLDVGPGWNQEMLEHAWTWLETNRPRPSPTSISWGDARIGNMIFRDLEVVAVLDWDTVSLAGPEADLAWWIQMDRHSWELLPGLGTPDELLAEWQQRTSTPARNMHWHLVFTAFRLGVIRMKLRRTMARGGLLAPEHAQPDAPNESIHLLALWLDERPPGRLLARKPHVSL